MKKLLKVLGIILFIFIAALILIPIIFKDDLVKLVKTETNKAVTAKVDFGDFDLSLIRSFPDFYFTIENVTITGIGEFEGVELANIKELDLTVDVMSVINGESINVKSIIIDEPNIHAKVLADGNANYLIVPEDTSAVPAVVEDTTTASSFKMDLQKIEIINGSVVYDDATLPVHMAIANLNLVLSGNLTENITNIAAVGGIETFNLTFDGIKYMNDVKVALNADVEANLEEFKFTFNENEISLNDLPLGFNGWVAMPNDPINMDLTFEAKKTEFKEILSLVPAEFTKDLEGVKTAGVMSLNGYAKGTFIDSTYPAFGIKMLVENAMFQYPDLPKSVTDIQIKASVESKDGNLNNTIVDVPTFHLKMAENPFDLNFYLATPISDPFIRAGLKGKLVLDNIKDIVPLEKGDELAGTFNADVSVEGNLSTIENEDYENFKAKGNLTVDNLHYASDSLDYPVDLTKAAIEFTPRYLELSQMDMKLGKSDVSAQGRLENFIGYALKDNQVLKGNLNVQSTLLDINELAGIDPNAVEEENSTTEEIETSEEATPMEAVVLPKNIDFTTKADIKKLVFDNIEMTNIAGNILFKDQKVSMENTTMNLLDGKMTMNGYYETTDSLKPTYDFGMDIAGFDMQQTVTTFNTVEKLAPIAKNATGNYSTKMKIAGALDSKMEPIFETMFGNGLINTQNIAIAGYKPLQKISQAIKYDKLDPLGLKDANISFKIVDGKVFVEPFDTKIGDTKLTIAGSNSFDQTIDYTFSFAIPRKEFGGAANNAIDGLLSKASSSGVDLSLAEVINIDVQLVGQATDPTIKTNFKQTASNMTNAIKDKAKEEFNKKKDELENKAKEEIEKQKAELEKRKKEAEEKARQEAEKQKEEAKKKLEDEAKKKLKGLFK